MFCLAFVRYARLCLREQLVFWSAEFLVFFVFGEVLVKLPPTYHGERGVELCAICAHEKIWFRVMV